MEWHEKSINEILKDLDSTKNGLSEKDAVKKLEKVGPNVLPEKKKATALQEFIGQFKNFLVIILIAAAVISLLLGELLDGAAIIAIVILNAAFGFFQERKAEKTLEALKKLAASKCKVLRDGQVRVIDASQIVPGDVLVLEVGDKVPADCRVIEETNLKIDESVLTGESTTVTKTIEQLSGKLSVADRKNIVFSGTVVVYGRCKALVVTTASSTEFGKIAASLQEQEEPTPLQRKLTVLARQLGVIILVVSAIVFAGGLLHGINLLEIFLTAVSLAIAAIPEGLPAVVTITLAIGLARMAKKNVIIRRLPAAEALGATSVICSDKTGTLTKNEMTVRKIYVDDKIFDVTGEGYNAKGRFMLGEKEIGSDKDLEMILNTGMLCNNALLGNEKARNENIGDPTEIALLVSNAKYGLKDVRSEHVRLKDIEFDSKRKMMSVVYKLEHATVMYTKGAVEEVLKRCTSIYRDGAIDGLRGSDRDKILSVNQLFAEDALRVLAFAIKKIKNDTNMEEKDMIFVGLQAMMDPPRPEARNSMAVCKEAGIRTVMITGDHRATAVAVAKELDMIDDKSIILTGAELDAMSNEKFDKIADDVVVYARVSPEHKVRITDALKKKNHIVAMTGDGVNDAPALKKADIGVAMGISGTDVAKEASDMILTDDNFASIVSAVEEGRGIYDNIKKFILYLLSCNIAEVIVVFAALMFIRDPATGLFVLPLLPLQLLWINLVTDGIPALALGMEPYEPDIMKRKPRGSKEKILDRASLVFAVIVGVVLSAAALYLFYMELPDVNRARTMAFTSVVVFEMVVALSFRSSKYVLGRAVVKNNRLIVAILITLALQFAVVHVGYLNAVFGTVPLAFMDWVRLFMTAVAIFILVELTKMWDLHHRISGMIIK